MFRTIKTLIAIAALSGTVGANVQAKEVAVQKEKTFSERSQLHNASVNYLSEWNDLTYPGDILNISTAKHYLQKKEDSLFTVLNENQITPENLITWNDPYTNLIYSGLNLVNDDNSVTPDQMGQVTQVEINPTGIQTDPVPTVPVMPEGSQSPETSSISLPINADVQQENAPQPVKNTEASVPAPTLPTVPASDPSPATSATVTAPVTAPAPTTPSPTPAPATVQQSPAPTQAASTPAPEAAPSDGSKDITVLATAYTASCDGCSGITKTGVNLKANPDAKVIAVDPSVIPLGSKVLIEGYGEATAADTGGAIKGNRIDVYMQNESDALQFGAKELKVKILN
jgi:3D (Asp-Asp-Asp) domain-containing protein